MTMSIVQLGMIPRDRRPQQALPQFRELGPSQGDFVAGARGYLPHIAHAELGQHHRHFARQTDRRARCRRVRLHGMPCEHQRLVRQVLSDGSGKPLSRLMALLHRTDGLPRLATMRRHQSVR